MNLKTAFHTKVKTPVRVDLSGGTVDIWPIYLLLEQPVTVNLAVDLFAETTLSVTPAKTGSIQLSSADRKKFIGLTPEKFLQYKAPPELVLHWKLLKYFVFESPESQLLSSGLTGLDLKLETRAGGPAGAGLGGSSSLAISLAAAIAQFAWGIDQNEVLEQREKLISIVKDVETQILGVPAGLQDYYGAAYGGLQSISWQVNGHQREPISSDIGEAFQRRILLFYSGKSRNSGMNNWELFKGFIDRDPQIQKNFQKISSITAALTRALKSQDHLEAMSLIAEEWAVRKTLAQGISTPEIDEAFSYFQSEGVRSGKICGAGGGGCFFVALPDEALKKREQLIAQVCRNGIEHLPAQFAPTGIQFGHP